MVYLQHPRHGRKIAYEKWEVDQDIKNGWIEYEPESAVGVATHTKERTFSPEIPAIEKTVVKEPEGTLCPGCGGRFRKLHVHKRFCKKGAV